jgi:nitroreductase
MTMMISMLHTRRSTPLKNMGGNAPSKDEIQQILQAATRIPDHNKLAPWWFVIFEGDARKEFGEQVLRKAYLLEDSEAAPAKLDLEAEKFLRAPLIIAVISRIKEGKAPQWEQFLSAGACCYNLCLAANALGFGTNWLTEWVAFNKDVHAALGMDERDNIAGFIYIGEQLEKPDDRERPALSDIVNSWSPEYKPSKGDQYGRVGNGYPRIGFKTI